MQGVSSFARSLAGVQAADRSLDRAASDVAEASAPSGHRRPLVPATGGSDPLDGASGDLIGPFVQMVAAQRAFEMNLRVLRSNDEVQRTLLQMVA